ncbi:MAG: S-adenosylmethionine decarboxylase [Leptospiraceae bacterium]|nr:S-adenosylmethionine decarboxylase [Leptospiraceae bacterium]
MTSLKYTFVDVDLRPSPIHKTGLFSNSYIKKGTTIGVLTGRFYSQQEVQNLSKEEQSFLIPIDEEILIGPESFYEIPALFYINHSCEPNAGIDGDLTIVALRDILPDEEITIDYATIFLNEQSFVCECKSPTCRKVIHGTDIFLPEIQKKYENHISSWIKRKLNIKPETIASKLQFEQTGAWGLVTALDLHDCDPELIRDRDAIYQYTIELCEKIKVKRFGEPIIVHFGEDERVAGYSLVQLIETSLVSGHFANLTNRVYLDIFSCAYYDPKEVIEYSKNFFKAKDYHCKIYLRH